MYVSELGNKRTCSGCAARFYDLGRAPAVCPKCATVQAAPVPAFASQRRAPSTRWSGGAGPGSRRAPVEDVEQTAADVEVEEPDDAGDHDNDAGDNDDDDAEAIAEIDAPEDAGAAAVEHAP